jgi:hypothetical protein
LAELQRLLAQSSDIAQQVQPIGRPATTAPTTQAPPTPAPTAAPLSADGPLLDAQFSTQQPSWPEQAPFAAWSNGAYRLSAREANHFVAVARTHHTVSS